MTGRRQPGLKIPLIQRIRRYGTMATIFRTYDDTAEVQTSLSDPTSHSPSRAQVDASVVKATLLPGGSSLPVGMMIPASGIAPPVRRAPSDIPRIQRDVGIRAMSPYQPPIAPEFPVAPLVEPVLPTVPDEGAQELETESSISEEDWTRLQAVMRGHEEKIEREQQMADSPEQVQLAAEKAEQEATKKRTETETKRRQELARQGQLPKAQVVYLSPDDPSPMPKPTTIPPGVEATAETDSEEPLDDIEPLSETSREPEVEEIAEKKPVEIERPTEEVGTERPAREPLIDQASHPDAASAPREVALTRPPSIRQTL